jgi:hypothetical protein
MNRKDIIRMARSDEWAADVSLKWDDFFVRFATLVVAAEREACAKVCEDIYNDPKGNNGDDYYYTRPYLECAAAIRARSQL